MLEIKLLTFTDCHRSLAMTSSNQNRPRMHSEKEHLYLGPLKSDQRESDQRVRL